MQYGERELELALSNDFLARHIRITDATAEIRAKKTTRECVEEALRELDDHDFFASVSGKKLALLVSDATRSESREAVLEPLLRRLNGVHEVVLVLCTGTHDPAMPENVALARRLENVAKCCPATVHVEVHDARSGEFCDFGSTSRGTSVRLSQSVHACEAFLVVSDLKTHYFAGYSNPLKNFLPGVAALESVRANHSLALDRNSACGRHPWNADAKRRHNPIAEDMLEAFELFVGERPHFAFCTLTTGQEVSWASAGPMQEVTQRGFAEVDRSRMIEVEPQRYLVVSAGGHPLDESLYTCQRALELTRAGVRPGGEVLFLAQCANGIGPPSARENFFERLQAPIPDVLAGLEREYVLYSHKAWKFADYLSGLAKVSLVSSLAPAEVRSIHLEPVAAEKVSSVLERWQREAGPDDRVLAVDDASKLLLVAGRDQVPMP